MKFVNKNRHFFQKTKHPLLYRTFYVNLFFAVNTYSTIYIKLWATPSKYQSCPKKIRWQKGKSLRSLYNIYDSRYDANGRCFRFASRELSISVILIDSLSIFKSIFKNSLWKRPDFAGKLKPNLFSLNLSHQNYYEAYYHVQSLL